MIICFRRTLFFQRRLNLIRERNLELKLRGLVK